MKNNEESAGKTGTYLLLCSNMVRMNGYMISWTTHGVSMQEEKRGFVRNRRIGLDDRLRRGHINEQKNRPVKFNPHQRNIVRDAIKREAEILGQKIYAISVGQSHVHMVVNCIDEATGDITGRYKKAAIEALRTSGFSSKVWTKGYDTRYCFDEESLRARIEYVQMHNKLKKNG